MSNLEKAEQLILGRTATDAAKALKDAGLLAEEEYQYGVSYVGINHGERNVEWVEPSGDAELDEPFYN